MNKDQIQAEALNAIANFNRCTIAVSMGVGKTRIGLKWLENKGKALIVVPKNSVKDSWVKEKDIIKSPVELEFVTYLSLCKKDPSNYNVIVLDECHNLLSKHREFLNVFTGKILGMTGTPPVRKSSEKYIMVQQFCPVKYTYTVDSATEDKILNDYIIYVHRLKLNNKKTLPKKRKDGKVWYTSEADDYVWHTNNMKGSTGKDLQWKSIMRMKSMMNYTSKEEYTKKLLRQIDSKCIVFANTQEQADRLCKHSYHSNNNMSEQNLEMFSDGRINQLSCVLQLSEGITIPKLKQGIILHAYGNERKSAQRIGRLLRLSPEETAICHVLCYVNTVDAFWIDKALDGFEMHKIRFVN